MSRTTARPAKRSNRNSCARNPLRRNRAQLLRGFSRRRAFTPDRRADRVRRRGGRRRRGGSGPSRRGRCRGRRSRTRSPFGPGWGDSTPGPYGASGSTAASAAAAAPVLAVLRRSAGGAGGGPTLTAPASTSARIAWHTSRTGRFVLRTRSRTLRRPSSATMQLPALAVDDELLDAELVGEPDPAVERRDHGLDLAPLLDAAGRARRWRPRGRPSPRRPTAGPRARSGTCRRRPARPRSRCRSTPGEQRRRRRRAVSPASLDSAAQQRPSTM